MSTYTQIFLQNSNIENYLKLNCFNYFITLLFKWVILISTKKRLFILGLLFSFSILAAEKYNEQEQLLNDLMVVEYWNHKNVERFPIYYNHLLQGGYFNMPSALMGNTGEIGIGYSSVPPYLNYNLRCQLLNFLEISGNYRVFRGVDDPILSKYGFGDLSDKGANFKFAILRPEDSHYKLPGVAFGFEDFMGTRNFKAKYIVLTQVFLDYSLEASIGYGGDRIHRWFGGVTWMPFLKGENHFLKPFAFCAEYDATPYKNKNIEKHPKGRSQKFPINFGCKYRLWNYFDFSLSYIRGKKVAFSASVFYNLGETKGLIPKNQDPLPYAAPVNYENVGFLRPLEVFSQDLYYAFLDQGFTIFKASLGFSENGTRVLRLHIYNLVYRLERQVRFRLNNLVASLIPENVSKVIIILEAEGIPIQEYHYNMEMVRKYINEEICEYELNILTPLCEVSVPSDYEYCSFFEKKLDWFNFEVFPKTRTLFGSAQGKFKYSLGVNFGANGYLHSNLFYSLRFGYIFLTTMGKLPDKDRLNPSQLINVRTDIVRYFQQKSLTVDEAYIQKNWNLGRGFYSRISLGIFEVEYGGIASEVLYYPVNSPWAIGIEGAIVKKRTFKGVGFTNKIRKLDGFTPTYQNFTGYQYFLNGYYDWQALNLDFRVSVGKFLANDYGVRTEISRYFPSGLRISIWYTYTNGHDKINGKTYYDKGIAFSMPVDAFYNYSSRTRWGYGMSAWLRDVGASAYTGETLYNMINEQRQDY